MPSQLKVPAMAAQVGAWMLAKRLDAYYLDVTEQEVTISARNGERYLAAVHELGEVPQLSYTYDEMRFTFPGGGGAMDFRVVVRLQDMPFTGRLAEDDGRALHKQLDDNRQKFDTE